MVLKPGARVGSYEIVEFLGAGGMGEVWRARDTTLGHHLALKVLPGQVAVDRERMARVEREAKALAALNHSNVATLYGFERIDGSRALVMELVEGLTLADRISQAPLRTPEVIAIARQIACALEAAHEKGIVHRDLKPANVKIKPDGTVKVLDFGLATVIESSAPDEAANAPTVSSPLVTAKGEILGTAPYMSPEQARGKSVDKRSDIWAFGCVVYEMAVRQRAFQGDTVADTLAAVLEHEPDWQALPPDFPDGLLQAASPLPRKGCAQTSARHR